MTSYPFAKNFTHPCRAPLTDLHRAAKTQDAATKALRLGSNHRDTLTMSNALAASRQARINANSEGLI
jgi:hypothetical protein